MESEKDVVKIYPNGFNETLTVLIDPSAGEVGTVTLENVTGTEVERFVKGEKGQFNFNGRHLPMGMYLVSVIFSNGSHITRKVAKW